LSDLKPLKHLLILLVLAVVITLVATGPSVAGEKKSSGKKSTATKKICITFDEVPLAVSFGDADQDAITYLILEALKRHDVKATGFVVGEQMKDSFDVLGQWLNGGHGLGNMTFSGQDYNRLGPEQFIGDIRKGAEALEPMLSGFGQKKRYFRFPYLHYGDNVERRKAVTLYLDELTYVVCPATVIPEDYLHNLTLIKMGKEPDSTKFVQLLNDYINHVLDELERQEQLAREIVSRPIKQILRLRTNRLNAVYLDELLSALENTGYKFITLDDALKDKVYSIPEGYYGLKGLSYLEMIINSDPDLVPAQ